MGAWKKYMQDTNRALITLLSTINGLIQAFKLFPKRDSKLLKHPTSFVLGL